MGSRCSCRVHARSDARKPIDEATMWWWHRSCEGEEGKRAKSSVRGKNHIVGLLFFVLPSQKYQTLGEGLIFYSPYCFASWQITIFTK